MRLEAKELTKLFGEEYADYARRVPLFFPHLAAYETSVEKFDMELYMRYREYRAALGLIFAWSILLVKAIFLK
jgi:hypothetical protein